MLAEKQKKDKNPMCKNHKTRKAIRTVGSIGFCDAPECRTEAFASARNRESGKKGAVGLNASVDDR